MNIKQQRYPSSIMYGTLKGLSVSHRDAARTILNLDAELDGTPLSQIIENNSRLSRRIAHARHSLPAEFLSDFNTSIPLLATTVVEKCAVEHYTGNLSRAARRVISKLTSAHNEMTRSLAQYGREKGFYTELLARIDNMDVDDPVELVSLHLMALVVGGCTFDARAALSHVIAFATDVCGVELTTAETVVLEQESAATESASATYGIVRIENGVIKSGSHLHPIAAAGTVIGIQPGCTPCITDVGLDVSRRHARLWVEDGVLFIVDLNSTNGTSIISGSSGEAVVVSPPSTQRSEGFVAQAHQLTYADVICLGATTRFMVLPDIDME